MNDKIKIIGECTVRRINLLTGKVIDEEIKKNLIVNIGKENVAKMLIDDAAYEYNGIIIGTGEASGAPFEDDTDLISFLQGATATKAYEASYKATWTHLFTFSGSYTITEAAVSKDATAGDILNHVIFSPGKEVSTTIGLDITFKITVGTA